MEEVRFVNVDSLLKKQYSPLHTSPVISVSNVENEPYYLFQPLVCPNCSRKIYTLPGYEYCPYCSNSLKEVTK